MFNLTRQEQVIVIFLIGAIIVGAGVFYHRSISQRAVEPKVVETVAIPEEKEEPKTIKVDVGGAVWKPGVYELKEGSRVEELLEKAMPREDAALDAINLARPLLDGEKVIVPTKEEVITKGIFVPTVGSQVKGKININKATKEQLETLPDIGPVRAQSIIDYRRVHGPFKDIEELKEIRGIGDKTFERLKDLITVY